MPRKLVVEGQRRGSQTIIRRVTEHGDRHPKYLVRCDCGAERIVGGATLSNVTACKKCHPGGAKRKYGDRVSWNTKIYNSWVAMRRRCSAPHDPRNARWAGRGIKVCRDWDESFPAFEAWALANGYAPGLSLDRIDNDGDYEPANCEWVTRSENSKRCRALYQMLPRGIPRLPKDIAAFAAKSYLRGGNGWEELAIKIEATLLGWTGDAGT